MDPSKIHKCLGTQNNCLGVTPNGTQYIKAFHIKWPFLELKGEQVRLRASLLQDHNGDPDMKSVLAVT